MMMCVFVLLLLLSVATSYKVELVHESPLGATGSWLGLEAEIDGDNAIVGAFLEEGTFTEQGRVYFWRRTNGVWAQTESFFSENAQTQGRLGSSVAIAGDYAAAGAYLEDIGGVGNSGAVYIFKRVGGVWTRHETLADTSGLAEVGDTLGDSVAMSEDGVYLASGGFGGDTGANTNTGMMVIWERNGSGNYIFKQRMSMSAAQQDERFGRHMAVSGTTILAPAIEWHDGSVADAGRAGIFKRESGTWTLKQVLLNPTPAENEKFGSSVALDTSIPGWETAVVGGNGLSEFYVYNMDQATGDYVLNQTVTVPGSTAFLGRAVAVSGHKLVATSDLDGDVDGGAAYFFERDTSSGEWTLADTHFGDDDQHIGSDVSLDGSTGDVLVGARRSQGDDGQVLFFHALPEAHPGRCGSYDSVGKRYFYDDGTGCESTPTINDACYYSAGDLATTDAATLRVDLSELKADGGEDYVYLAFDLADKYYNHRLVFADSAEGECRNVDWEQVSATRDVTSLDACETTFVYRLPWSDAYNSTGSKCGWERDGTGANVKLVLDFAVQAEEDLSTTRDGSTIRREVEFSMPVQVEFPVQVTASPVNVTVFAPVRALAVITGQTVTIDEASVTATLTLDLFTEVQDPFELHAIVESTDVLPTGVTLVTAMSGVEDEAVRQDDECTDGSADCANTWRWQYTTPSVAGGSNPCDFDGTYQVTFGVRCSDVAETNCPIDGSTDSVEITLAVSTSNHCPTVVDSVDLSAALAVYDLPARADAQDDFVGDGTQEDGQTADLSDWQVAYFAAPVTSSQVAIDRTEFNQVWIVRHQETVSVADDDVVVLLDADDTIDESPYDGVGEIDCAVVAGVAGADATATAVSAATGCSPAKDGVGGTYSFEFKHGEGGNAVAGGYSTPIFEFDIRTDGAGFNMADDAIEEMQVNAVIDVEYANAAKRTGGAVQNNAQQSTVTSSFSMRTTSGTSSSGSTALFGVNAMVVYGAGAVLAVVVVAAAVVLLRRKPSPGMQKVESSTELSTSAV